MTLDRATLQRCIDICEHLAAELTGERAHGAQVCVAALRMLLPEPPPRRQPVVHILRRGFALCGFNPPGHWWIGSEDHEHATCQRCIEIHQEGGR